MGKGMGRGGGGRGGGMGGGGGRGGGGRGGGMGGGGGRGAGRGGGGQAGPSSFGFPGGFAPPNVPAVDPSEFLALSERVQTLEQQIEQLSARLAQLETERK